MAAVTINLINETAFSPKLTELTTTLGLILRRLGRVGKVEVELLLVGDEKIKTLNKEYRGKNQSTDVLSFPASQTSDENMVGSIVVSIESAARQASQAGISTTDELKTLFGHGFLHLLGFHHH